MARKIYFDTRSRDVIEYLKSRGFQGGFGIYKRSMLEVRQENGKIYLINNARKEYRMIDGMFLASHLREFVRTGILPHKNLIKPLPVE